MQYRFETPVSPGEVHFASADHVPQAASWRRLRIVVAEDNPDAADALQMLLEISGHEVQLVHTGPAAVDAVHRYLPDALLCDIGLPGMSGFEVARTLRANSRFSGLLMIAVTGYADSRYAATALACGFDRHFSKGVDPQSILDELKNFARRE